MQSTTAFILFALSMSSTALGQDNSVIYEAYSGQVPPSSPGDACTGQRLGQTAASSDSGQDTCHDVGQGACVLMGSHVGDPGACDVELFSAVGCDAADSVDRIEFDEDIVGTNINFASFKAFCSQ